MYLINQTNSINLKKQECKLLQPRVNRTYYNNISYGKLFKYRDKLAKIIYSKMYFNKLLPNDSFITDIRKLLFFSNTESEPCPRTNNSVHISSPKCTESSCFLTNLPNKNPILQNSLVRSCEHLQIKNTCDETKFEDQHIKETFKNTKQNLRCKNNLRIRSNKDQETANNCNETFHEDLSESSNVKHEDIENSEKEDYHKKEEYININKTYVHRNEKIMHKEIEDKINKCSKGKEIIKSWKRQYFINRRKENNSNFITYCTIIFHLLLFFTPVR